MQGSPIRSELIRYITERPGRLLYVEDMAQHVGRTVRSVSSGVYNLRRDLPDFAKSISVVVAGKVWRYDGEPTYVPDASPQPPARPVNGSTGAPVVDVLTRTVSGTQLADADDDGGNDGDAVVDSRPGRLFEELGDVGDGCVLVVDEAGNPYKLVPLHD